MKRTNCPYCWGRMKLLMSKGEEIDLYWMECQGVCQSRGPLMWTKYAAIKGFECIAVEAIMGIREVKSM